MGNFIKKITHMLWATLTIGVISVALAKQLVSTNQANPIIIVNKSPYTAVITISYQAPVGNFFAKKPSSDIDIIIGSHQSWAGGKQAPIESLYGTLKNPHGTSHDPRSRKWYSTLQPAKIDKNYEYMFEIREKPTTAPTPTRGSLEYSIKQLKARKRTIPPTGAAINPLLLVPSR